MREATVVLLAYHEYSLKQTAMLKEDEIGNGLLECLTIMVDDYRHDDDETKVWFQKEGCSKKLSFCLSICGKCQMKLETTTKQFYNFFKPKFLNRQ